MSARKKYVLDTNVYIQAHRYYYRPAFCPGFWEAIQRGFDREQICSIDRVKEEIHAGKDWLCEWCEGEGVTGMFMDTRNPAVGATFGRVQKWCVSHPRFTEAAKATFASVADSWIIAYAMANDCSVVTLEEPNPDCRNRVLIPSACAALGVEYLNTFALLQELGVRLSLK